MIDFPQVDRTFTIEVISNLHDITGNPLKHKETENVQMFSIEQSKDPSPFLGYSTAPSGLCGLCLYYHIIENTLDRWRFRSRHRWNRTNLVKVTEFSVANQLFGGSPNYMRIFAELCQTEVRCIKSHLLSQLLQCLRIGRDEGNEERRLGVSVHADVVHKGRRFQCTLDLSIVEPN